MSFEHDVVPRRHMPGMAPVNITLWCLHFGHSSRPEMDKTASDLSGFGPFAVIAGVRFEPATPGL
jgi:hypothetical protein